MGSFRLKRKTFGLGLEMLGGAGASDMIQAKKAMQRDALKHGEIGSFIKQGFYQSPSSAQKFLDRNPNSKYADTLKSLYGKRVTIPSPVQQSQMGMPGPGASASY